MLADYDMALANVLVSGVDVWLNTPLRPLEACGTSGMKAALNGVLNLSILDGWWDECYAPAFGWAIPSADGDALDADARDAREAASILDLIEHELAPRFYERDDGLPRAWLAHDPRDDQRARPAAARDAHGARLRAGALPADGRGCRVGRRGPLSCRAAASRGRGYNRAVHDEEAR